MLVVGWAGQQPNHSPGESFGCRARDALSVERLADAKDAYTKALATFAAVDARLGEAKTVSALGQLDIVGPPHRGLRAAPSRARDAPTIDERLGTASQLGT